MMISACSSICYLCCALSGETYCLIEYRDSFLLFQTFNQQPNSKSLTGGYSRLWHRVVVPGGPKAYMYMQPGGRVRQPYARVSNVKPTFLQDRKLSFCCFCSEKDRIKQFLKQNSGSKQNVFNQFYQILVQKLSFWFVSKFV